MKKKEKIQLVIIGLVIITTALFLWFQNRGSEKEKRIWIARPENGTKTQRIAMSIDEKEEEWNLTVESREKTTEEIDRLFSETIQILNECFGIQDGGKLVLTDSVSLPQSLPETGADIRWESSDATVLTKSGKLQREHLKEVCELHLQARVYLAEEEREYWFAVEVPPYASGSEEALLYEAQESLLALEQETSGEEGFYLPEEIGPVTIGIPESSGSVAGPVAAVVLCLPFAVVIAKRQEKEKEKQRRAEELLTSYPQLVTKLTLYTGAGLSLRGAWERLAAEYRAKAENSGKKNAVGEEILILAGELKNGASEAKAYEAFGKRIALRPYLRCVSLMVSQLQKGSGGMRKGLQEEVRLAWEMHREHAAKKGEEAQTKMLFPMMGMLCLVMAVVMIPAFFSM